MDKQRALNTAVERFLEKWPSVLDNINEQFARNQLRTRVLYDGPTIGSEIDAMSLCAQELGLKTPPRASRS